MTHQKQLATRLKKVRLLVPQKACSTIHFSLGHVSFHLFATQLLRVQTFIHRYSNMELFMALMLMLMASLALNIGLIGLLIFLRCAPSHYPKAAIKVNPDGAAIKVSPDGAAIKLSPDGATLSVSADGQQLELCMNPNSDVFHEEGCFYLKAKFKRLRGCKYCNPGLIMCKKQKGA